MKIFGDVPFDINHLRAAGFSPLLTAPFCGSNCPATRATTRQAIYRSTALDTADHNFAFVLATNATGLGASRTRFSGHRRMAAAP
jgi:hypothetical protein